MMAQQLMLAKMAVLAESAGKAAQAAAHAAEAAQRSEGYRSVRASEGSVRDTKQHQSQHTGPVPLTAENLKQHSRAAQKSKSPLAPVHLEPEAKREDDNKQQQAALDWKISLDAEAGATKTEFDNYANLAIGDILEIDQARR